MNRSIKNNPVLLFLIIFILLIISGSILTYITGDQSDSHQGEKWGGPWHMMGMGGFWMFPFLPILFFVLILYLVFGRDLRHWPGHDTGDSAIEILKKRYANGEITKEEFNDMKKELIS